jgi:hypothetical protein
MTFIYAIPTTGRATLERAVRSAQSAYTVVVRHDESGHGPQAARNWLLDEAARMGAEFIRYGDDDDLCLPAKLGGGDADVVYFDYLRYGEVVRLGADPVQAMFRGVTPWCWAARVDALTGAGLRWDESRPCRQGSWMWLAMLQAGLRFSYAPVIAYEKVAPGAISSKPEFAEASRQFFAAAREWAGAAYETHYRAAMRAW